MTSIITGVILTEELWLHQWDCLHPPRTRRRRNPGEVFSFFFVLMKNKCCVGFSYIRCCGFQMWLNFNTETCQSSRIHFSDFHFYILRRRAAKKFFLQSLTVIQMDQLSLQHWPIKSTSTNFWWILHKYKHLIWLFMLKLLKEDELFVTVVTSQLHRSVSVTNCCAVI